MAEKTGVTEQEYLDCEAGLSDLNFAFIYRCALAFNVDVTDIIEGKSPTLKSFTVTRRGAGKRIEEAHGMTYYNLAAPFRNRIAEPLYVNSRYSEEAQHRDIELTTHAGQECDIVIEGQLKVQIGEHKEILGPGDSIYYDSSTPHGMIAVGGKDCLFYAIVLNPTGEPIPELQKQPLLESRPPERDTADRVYTKRALPCPSSFRTRRTSTLLTILWMPLRKNLPTSWRCSTFPGIRPKSGSPSGR